MRQPGLCGLSARDAAVPPLPNNGAAAEESSPLCLLSHLDYLSHNLLVSIPSPSIILPDMLFGGKIGMVFL